MSLITSSNDEKSVWFAPVSSRCRTTNAWANITTVAGDLVSAAFSLYIVAESAYLGVSFTTLVEMLTNITIDVVGGSIPYVGTVVDTLWKANKRNVALAPEDLAEAVETDGAGGRTDGGVEIPIEPDD